MNNFYILGASGNNQLSNFKFAYQGVAGYNFKIQFCFFFVLANSVDPDEMPHHAAFHQGLHCLPKLFKDLGVI